MISRQVNVSIVIVQLLDNDTILYHLEIIIQFLDVLSIPVLILLFSFGKKKLKDCKDIVCCIKEEEKTIKPMKLIALLLMNRNFYKIQSKIVMIQVIDI